MNGTLFIISAPSGAGKTSLVSALLDTLKNIQVSVSYTTREKRPAETNNQDYHFIDQNTFMGMLDQGDFLEHAEVFGNYYGTSASWTKNHLKDGMDIILEIDWQGAQQVRKALPDATTIFIMPPSATILQERLKSRGQDSDEVISKRMAGARREIEHFAEYDYVIVNDNFEQALDELKAVILSQRIQSANLPHGTAKLIQRLLDSLR